MPELLSLLTGATLPIFAVSAVGFAMARMGRFSHAQAEGVNAFTMRVAVPALIFMLLAEADLRAYEWRVLFVYMAAEIVVYAATFALCRFLLGIETREALLLGMAAIFVNGVFFVLPIASLLYGPAAEPVIVGIIVIDSTILFGGTIFLMDVLTRDKSGLGGLVKVLTGFAVNPVILAMAAGMAVSLSGVVLPEGIATYARFVGAAASPTALFALGVILASVELRTLGRTVPVVVTMKMLGQPLVTFLMLGALAAPGLWADTTLLFTAGPAGAMPFVIALSYGIRSDRIATVMIVTTLVSLIALPAVSIVGG